MSILQYSINEFEELSLYTLNGKHYVRLDESRNKNWYILLETSDYNEAEYFYNSMKGTYESLIY